MGDLSTELHAASFISFIFLLDNMLCPFFFKSGFYLLVKLNVHFMSAYQLERILCCEVVLINCGQKKRKC